MNLTKEERKVLIHFLNQHIKEIEINEAVKDQTIKDLAAEFNYEEFLQEIIGKLEG